MKFIKLTSLNGAPIWFRADRITVVESKTHEGRKYADVFIGEKIDESSVFPVKQAACEILAQIES